MAAETTDITVDILRRIQAEQAAHRLETRAIQQSFVDLARLVQRLDARISDVKSDLETMFKMELIGQHPHLETRLEARFDTLLNEALIKLSERLDRIEQRLP